MERGAYVLLHQSTSKHWKWGSFKFNDEKNFDLIILIKFIISIWAIEAEDFFLMSLLDF